MLCGSAHRFFNRPDLNFVVSPMQRPTSRHRSTVPPPRRRRPDTRSSCRPSSSPPSTSPTPAASSTPPPVARRPPRPKVSRVLKTVENGDAPLERRLTEQISRFYDSTMRVSVVVVSSFHFFLPCQSHWIVLDCNSVASLWCGQAEDEGPPCAKL